MSKSKSKAKPATPKVDAPKRVRVKKPEPTNDQKKAELNERITETKKLLVIIPEQMAKLKDELPKIKSQELPAIIELITEEIEDLEQELLETTEMLGEFEKELSNLH
jgi:Mg2+ and Co2+ transporter CorA